MSSANHNNLDLYAAEAAQRIISNTKTHIKPGDVENLTTKTLGVLQENGVYAAYLYLYSRSEGEQPIAKQIRMQLLPLTSKLHLSSPTDRKAIPQDADTSAVLNYLTESICKDLDTLLLVKQLWEQTLIYTRYGAKARGVQEKIEEKIAEEAKKAKEEAEKVKSQP